MWQFLEKINKYVSYLILVFGLSIPLLLFLNRFLIPDVSFDSTNYHYYLGYKGFYPDNNKYEFFPTGIHNFAPFFDMFGYGLSTIVGYRLGTVTSLIFTYLSIFVAYKLVKLIDKKIIIIGDSLNSFLFVSSFLSFELFLGIATYYVDAISMFFLLLTTYFLFRLLIEKREKYLYLSALVLSLAILGKQTNLYYVFPYGAGVLYFLIVNKYSLSSAIKKLLLVGLTLISTPLPWYLKNYLLTGNPIFPFYNGIFKSIYFPEVNFSQVIFGGRNLLEKLFWGVYSIFEPVRLGEIHDLFNDYKINLYFIVPIILFLVLLLETKKLKNKILVLLFIFYLIAFEFWSLEFGYLRYALALEVIGGLLIMLLFSSVTNKRIKWFLLIPVLVFLVFQNKRIVNTSLVYDLSFRPGFYYNRVTYPEHFKHILNSSLKLNDEIDREFIPDVYLVCAPQGTTSYTLSEYRDLPIINISQKSYGELVNNNFYKKESSDRLEELIDVNKFNFVTIVSNEGLGNEYVSCINSIEAAGYVVKDQFEIDFMGSDFGKYLLISGSSK